MSPIAIQSGVVNAGTAPKCRSYNGASPGA